MPGFFEQMVGSLADQSRRAQAAKQQQQVMDMQMLMSGFAPPQPQAPAPPGTPLSPDPMADAALGGVPPLNQPGQVLEDLPTAQSRVADTIKDMFIGPKPRDYSNWQPSRIHPEVAATERTSMQLEGQLQQLHARLGAEASNLTRSIEARERLQDLDWDRKEDMAYLQQLFAESMNSQLTAYQSGMLDIERAQIAQRTAAAYMGHLDKLAAMQHDKEMIFADPTKFLEAIQAWTEGWDELSDQQERFLGIPIWSPLYEAMNPAWAALKNKGVSELHDALALYGEAVSSQAKEKGVGHQAGQEKLGKILEDELARIQTDTAETGLLPGFGPTPAVGDQTQIRPLQQNRSVLDMLRRQ